MDRAVRNLTKWLEMDANSCQEMSRQAKNSFATRFHVKKATERLLEIIEGDSNCRLSIVDPSFETVV